MWNRYTEMESIASMIQVRVDDDLKTKSDALFKDLGTDTTTAIRMFLTQALAVNGFPFEKKGQIRIHMEYWQNMKY